MLKHECRMTINGEFQNDKPKIQRCWAFVIWVNSFVICVYSWLINEHFGIIGGLGPESTIDLLSKRSSRSNRERTGDGVIRNSIIASVI